MVELEKQPLGPLVVRRVGGREDVLPVEHPAERGQLPGKILDVVRDQHARVDAHFEGEIFAVDPEGIEPDWLEHRVSAEPHEPAVDVATGKGVEIPDMEPLGGGVGEHHQIIERLRGLIEVGLVGMPFGPALLPLGFEGLGE